MTDEERKERRREYLREYGRKRRARLDVRMEDSRKAREKYLNDPEYRLRKLERAKKWNKEHRKKTSCVLLND